MNATGFPKGLYTEQELAPEFFNENAQNKLEIIQKAIDITKIVLNHNFDIKTKNIIKGEECDKTNNFLQMFHKAATSQDKDFQKYIKKYLEKREEKKKNKVDPPKEEPKKEPPKEDDGKKQAQKKKKVEDVKKKNL